MSGIFWEIHSRLPREGPGDDASTLRALAMMADLPPQPRILDVACGPGAQTMALARATSGTIVALDLHAPFLDEVARRADAAGCSPRVRTLHGSMDAMRFEDGAFDAIWCEGAIYFMGFQQGLTAWRPFLAPGGYAAVTEPCWMSEDPPAEVLQHWAEYPAMATIHQNQAKIAVAGFREIGHFVLPDAAWWDEYYLPMERKLDELREKYRDDAEALSGIAESQREIDLHRRYSEQYAYVFFVMQKSGA